MTFKLTSGPDVKGIKGWFCSVTIDDIYMIDDVTIDDIVFL